MATLVPCLVTLREEFNALNPDRDKSSDGWVGDEAHQSGDSDHNPDDSGNVHAIDVDENINVSGVYMEDCVQTVLRRCRKNNDDPDNEARLTYIIYERRIWSASDGWRECYYGGSNPHDKHAHFSAESASKYANDTSPWGIVEEWGGPVEVSGFSDAAKNEIRDQAYEALRQMLPGSAGISSFTALDRTHDATTNIGGGSPLFERLDDIDKCLADIKASLES